MNMLSKRIGNTLIVRVDRGEKLMEGIKTAVKKEKVRLGIVSGIGAASSTTLGVYNVEEKKYYQNVFNGIHEITHLSGNISEMNGETYLHLHITIADEKGHAYGGHLNEAVIGATSEIFIQILDGVIDRYKDEETGLNLLAF